MNADKTTKTANQLIKEQSMEAILNAAGACYLEKGLYQTTVDDIATRAKVGRATVFRHFKTKETIFTKYVQRECLRTTNTLRNVLEDATSPEDYITSLLLFIITESPKEPVYKIGRNDAQASSYTMDLDFFSLIGNELLEDTLPRIYNMANEQGKLRDGISLELMILWIKRLCISFVHNPMTFTTDPVEIKQYLNTLVVPSLLKH